MSATLALRTDLRPNHAGSCSFASWKTRFWLTEAPFIAPGEAHRRSRTSTRIQVLLDEETWCIRFECKDVDAGEVTITPELRAWGDPDLWRAEYVQIQMPLGTHSETLHLSVARDGQMVSERFDKQLDPIAGWSASTQETVVGWSADFFLPRAAVPEILKLRFARWVPAEGITRWPTPFGSWWHVDERDFLVVDANAQDVNDDLDSDAERFMRQREHELYKSFATPQSLEENELRRAAGQFISIPFHRSGALLRYFQQRVAEYSWLAFGALPEPDFERCRGLLSNRVYFDDASLELGPNPNWDDDHGNMYVMAHATRFDFLADLVAAYRASGDLVYARKAVEFIESWLDGNDVRQSLTPNRYPIRWRIGILISHRLVCMVRAVFSLLDAGVVSDSLLIRLFATVRESAGVLSLDLPRLYPKNHSIIVGDHMVQLSVLCAELRDADVIRAEYSQHLCNALEAQFLPDGVQAELSTTYQMVCYARLIEATSLCESAGVAVPEAIIAWRRRILGTAAKYLFPNGQIAAFNDGSMAGTVDTIGHADITLRDLILQDGPALGLNEALALAGAPNADAPIERSHALPYAGHFIMRDGLSPQSIAVAFDAGPFGIAHAHEDALSVMMVGFNKPLLIDIGSGAYDPDVPMRPYSTSTRSHRPFALTDRIKRRATFPNSGSAPRRTKAITGSAKSSSSCTESTLWATANRARLLSATSAPYCS